MIHRASPVPASLNADDAYVGQRLRERRRAANMTQTALGAVAGVSFQQVQKYERGANRISFSMLQRFANALDTPIQYFLREGGPGLSLASGHGQAPFDSPDRDTQSLLRLFNEIDDPALRRQVMQLARALVEAQKNPVKKPAARPAKKKPAAKS